MREADPNTLSDAEFYKKYTFPFQNPKGFIEMFGTISDKDRNTFDVEASKDIKGRINVISASENGSRESNEYGLSLPDFGKDLVVDGQSDVPYGKVNYDSPLGKFITSADFLYAIESSAKNEGQLGFNQWEDNQRYYKQSDEENRKMFGAGWMPYDRKGKSAPDSVTFIPRGVIEVKDGSGKTQKWVFESDETITSTLTTGRDESEDEVYKNFGLLGVDVDDEQVEKSIRSMKFTRIQ